MGPGAGRHPPRAGVAQFLLAPGPAARPGWETRTLAGGWELASDPALPVQVARSGERELALLGFMTDPRQPDLDDAGILGELLPRAGSARELAGACGAYGGRWVLVHHDGTDPVVLGDAAGLREVYHGGTPARCASQPGLVGDALGLRPDERIREGFLEPQRAADPQFWWPGTTSPYAGVHCLLPNHLLRLSTGTVERFHPSEPLRPIERERAVREAADLLRGQMQAVARRAPLALSVTAGIDSRVVLAAARGLDPAPVGYTFLHGTMTRRHADAGVPRRLLRRAGWRHLTIATPETMSPGFAAVHDAHATAGHPFWGGIIEALVEHYPAGHVAVDGTVAEVARRFYHPRLAAGAGSDVLDAPELARLTRMTPVPLVLEAFDGWLTSGREVARELGYDCLDLFYWEQRIGRWAASALTELDLAQETFTPFAHRELLELLLRVEPGARSGPGYELFRELVRELWPELLRAPINPPPLARRLRRLAGRPLRGLRRLLRG